MFAATHAAAAHARTHGARDVMRLLFLATTGAGWRRSVAAVLRYKLYGGVRKLRTDVAKAAASGEERGGSELTCRTGAT